MMNQWKVKLLGSFSALVFVVGCSSSAQSALAPNPHAVSNKQKFVVKTENITVSKLQALSNNGDPDAQYALGYRHFYGIGVARDMARSVELFQSAAAKGQSQAKEALRRIGHAHSHLASTHRAHKKHVLYLHNNHHHMKNVSAKTSLLPQKGYTLQLLGSKNKDKVKQFMMNTDLSHASTFYRTRHQGNDWYVVVSGRYPTRQAALSAIDQMPAALKDLKPWVKPLGLVSDEMILGFKR